MDVCEEEQIPSKGVVEEITRPPLVPSERNIAVIRKAKPTREIPSRYKAGIASPSLSTPGAKRSPSPNDPRTVRPPSPPFPPKRAQSTERRRASAPASPDRPSTPVLDTAIDRRSMGGRTLEGLWPSTTTVRSLSVSFQSDTFSLPISKKEKPVSDTSDYTLKPSANVTRKRSETPQRKETPERKRTPLRGKNDSNQLENAKPGDNSHMRILDQQRCPGRLGGNGPSRTGSMDLTDRGGRGHSRTRSMDLTDRGGRGHSRTRSMDLTNRGGMGPPRTRSMDLTDMASKITLPTPARNPSPLRRLPSYDGTGKDVSKNTSEVANQISCYDNGNVEYELYTVDDASLQSSEGDNFSISASGSQALPAMSSRPPSPNIGFSSSSLERDHFSIGTRRTQVLPANSRPPSPSKTLAVTPFPSRGLSPSRTRPLTPLPSTISMISRAASSFSVLSFVADVKKGKKGANHIEDVHQLRLLYNRYLQWRYVNAWTDATLAIQKETAEETLHNAWTSTTELRNNVSIERIALQQLRQELKLNSVLDEQLAYLDDWDSLEKEHSNSLAGATEALEGCTVRLPVTGGARGDVLMVKDAISSAVDVMQAMGSSICSLLSRVEGTGNSIAKLAEVAAQGRAMLKECEAVLALTSAMQVKENSLRIHLLQLNQEVRSRRRSLSATKAPLWPLRILH